MTLLMTDLAALIDKGLYYAVDPWEISNQIFGNVTPLCP